ncbi:hypothetical protein, partial [Novosphingobium pokkalii]|uniref:hypothetical protein n=1 Tax=Novosphingobium pokkalii TaxID=1770194 RepID=UPI001E2B43F3
CQMVHAETQRRGEEKEYIAQRRGGAEIFYLRASAPLRETIFASFLFEMLSAVSETPVAVIGQAA